MSHPRCSAALGVLLVAVSSPLAVRPARAAARPTAEAPSRSRAALPLRFEPNVGQAAPDARFVARGAGSPVAFTDDAAAFVAGGSVVALRFDGARAGTAPAPEAPSAGVNYFLGSDRSRWRGDVSSYLRLRRAGIYAGVDAVWDGDGGRLGLELDARSDADLAAVTLRVDGASRVDVTDAGDLVVTSGGERVAVARPRALVDGVASDARYRIDGDGRVRVERVAARERQAPPADGVRLGYLVYLGGSTPSEPATAVAADAAGHAYVAGYTISSDFPTTPGTYAPSGPNFSADVFVAELDETGTNLVFGTYFGGTDNDSAVAIAVDAAGDVFVAGNTKSPDLPIAGGAVRTALGGASDPFVAKLSAGGRALLYSSYLGSSSDQDFALGLAYVGDGRVAVVGNTDSPTFPVTQNAFRTTPGTGSTSGFVSVIDTLAPSGASALVYSTFLGGNAAVLALAVAADAGRVFVTGEVDATDFPTTPTAFRTAPGGSAVDAYALELDPSQAGAASLVYSTYFGGDGVDIGRGIASRDGLVYLCGWTTSRELPATVDAYRGRLSENGFPDGFLAVLDPSAAGEAALRYATYFGSTDLDVPESMAVDPAGTVWIGGLTNGSDFPTTPDAVGADGPEGDGFVVGLSPTVPGAGGLVFSTYLSGPVNEEVAGVAVDGKGDVFAAGSGRTLATPSTPTNIPRPTDDSNAFVVALRAPVADVGIAATAAAQFPAGLTATATFTVTNHGPDVARGTSVVFGPTDGATIEGVSDGNGVPVGLTGTASGELRTAAVDLAPGASATYVVAVTVTVSVGATVTIPARVASTAVDPVPANDAASATAQVILFPAVTSVRAAKDPFRVVIAGTGFAPGVAVFVGADATPWPTFKLKGSTKITLKGAGLKARFPKRAPVDIKIVNPDGGTTTTTFTR